MKTLKPMLEQRSTPKKLWTPDAQRGNRHERGYGKAWQAARRDALQRDCGLCQPCMARGHVTQATQVDHIKPKTEGGTDELDNLQSICAQCHNDKSRLEMNRRGRA